MQLLDQLAEQRINEARERGELDNLPGQGVRLHLDDDQFVPEHLRAGYRLLKNAGYLPPELQLRSEIKEVEDLLARLTVDDHAERSRAERRLQVLRSRLSADGGRGRDSSPIWAEPHYHSRLLERMGTD